MVCLHYYTLNCQVLQRLDTTDGSDFTSSPPRLTSTAYSHPFTQVSEYGPEVLYLCTCKRVRHNLSGTTDRLCLVELLVRDALLED